MQHKLPTGGFHKVAIWCTVQPTNSRLVARWSIISSGRLTAIRKFLFLKWLWDELSREEFSLFIDIPGVLSDPRTFACLKARADGLPKEIIRRRLLTAEKLLGLKLSSRSSWEGIKRLHVSFFKIETTAPRVQKYTGWARHHNDQGTLPKVKPDGLTLPYEEHLDVNKFWITLIVVGEIPFFLSEVTLPLMSSQEGTKRITANGRAKTSDRGHQR